MEKQARCGLCGEWVTAPERLYMVQTPKHPGGLAMCLACECEMDDEEDNRPIYLVPIVGAKADGTAESLGSVLLAADTPEEAVAQALEETMELYPHRPLTFGVVERLR